MVVMDDLFFLFLWADALAVNIMSPKPSWSAPNKHFGWVDQEPVTDEACECFLGLDVSRRMLLTHT